MIRAQCIVQREKKVLMVRHRLGGAEWWCLPGGRVEPGETPEQAALRELDEECGIRGRVIRQTSRLMEAEGIESITFWIEPGDQAPRLGSDPEFAGDERVLVDLRWLALSEISERDRAYLWAAGLLSVPLFTEELSSWGDEISYPIPK
jgi:8-oxo-dGTP pyrophosphatase MutT (NUDIX family)